jgi:hypothetical protein
LVERSSRSTLTLFGAGTLTLFGAGTLTLFGAGTLTLFGAGTLTNPPYVGVFILIAPHIAVIYPNAPFRKIRITMYSF